MTPNVRPFPAEWASTHRESVASAVSRACRSPWPRLAGMAVRVVLGGLAVGGVAWGTVCSAIRKAAK
jgi:hypothetical protein